MAASSKAMIHFNMNESQPLIMGVITVELKVLDGLE